MAITTKPPGSETIVHEYDPIEAAEQADTKGRALYGNDAAALGYFVEREVLNPDGSFPLGEGHLYSQTAPRAAEQAAMRAPTAVTTGHLTEAGNRGTKATQQDAGATVVTRIGDEDATILIVADGVSSAGPLADRASRVAVETFKSRLAVLLQAAGDPKTENARHQAVESAIEEAAAAANYETIRSVLLDQDGDQHLDLESINAWAAVLDQNGDGKIDDAQLTALGNRPLDGDGDGYVDAAVMRDLAEGVLRPSGELTRAQLEGILSTLPAVRAALTTFAVAAVVDDDVYTFNAGDSIAGLYRDGSFVHLTKRDQDVVQVFEAGGERPGDVYQNSISNFMGQATFGGRLRRYHNALRPGDRVVAATDGLGLNNSGMGLSPERIERELSRRSQAGDIARRLVEGQTEGILSVGDIARLCQEAAGEPQALSRSLRAGSPRFAQIDEGLLTDYLARTEVGKWRNLIHQLQYQDNVYVLVLDIEALAAASE